MVITEVVSIINSWVLSSSTYIENMLKTVQRNNTSGTVVNKLTIIGDAIEKRVQKSKDTILKENYCYVHDIWENN